MRRSITSVCGSPGQVSPVSSALPEGCCHRRPRVQMTVRSGASSRYYACGRSSVYTCGLGEFGEYIDTFGYDLPKVRGKGQIQFPKEDAFGYDLPKVRGKDHIHLKKEDRPNPPMPEAAFQFAPMAFRESIIPSAISPKNFDPTDLEELELLTKNLETSKDTESELLLHKQKQLEELEQRLASQDAEARGQLEQEKTAGRNLEERQRKMEEILEVERSLNEKLAAENREMHQKSQSQRDDLLQQKEQEIQAILREERLQSQELLAKQAARQSDDDKKRQAELDAVRAELGQVTRQLEEEIKSESQRKAKESKDSAARARLLGEVQACQAREEELQHALSQRDAEAANAARRVAQAEARLAAKEKAASESAEEAQQAFSRLNDLAEERNRLRSELEDFQVGAQQMQADSKQHLRQLQANRKELDSTSLEVRRLQQEKEELQSQLEKAKSKACALEIEQHQQQERKEQLQQQLRAQEQQLEHAEAASRQMALELEEAQGHVSQTAQTAQRCQGELEEHLATKSRDVEEARTALQRVVEDNGQLQALLEESQEKAAKLQEQVLSHDDRCKELEEDLILARAQLGALEARESELAQAAVAARRQETQEAELADLLAQKELLEAQLAATVARLDEEQAERIRQGARAETLETDLATQQRIYSEQASAARCKTLEHAWHQLAASATAHIQEMESRKLMSEIIASRRESQREGRRQLAEHAEILSAQQMKKQAQDDQVQKRQDEDIATCLKENEELRACNRELAQSLQQFKQENDQLHVDNSSLLESVALFEGDLGKVADRHAQLIGHVNKKQKIRYTVKLKEECAQLRLDLNKARHKLMQLEGSRRSDSLYGALASLGYSPAPAVQSSPQPKQRSQEQSPNSPFQQPPAAPAPVRVSPRCANTARGQLEEAQRRVRLQECALERVNSDFRHLLALVQRVIGRGQADESKEINFAELLQDLRRVMASQSHAPQGSTPVMGSAGPKMSPRTEASAGQKEPSTPRARDSLASPLSFRVAQEPLSEEPPRTQDKENQLNIQNQTPAETSKAVLPETSKAILPETQEAVRKVMKQINFALSFGSRKLYGRPIQDARSFFQALDRHGNGVLERKDIASGFKRLDIVLPVNTLEMLVKMVDQDANGFVSVDELLKALERSERVAAKSEGLPVPQLPRKRQ
eukprot:s4422_g2.t4